MEQQPKPSKTADLVAAARAEHVIRYNPPLFKDDFAFQLCGDFWQPILRSKLKTRVMLGIILRAIYPLAPLATVRAKFCEDVVAELINDGVDQYVIIGAGLDSFAMRRTEFENRVTVFELDQPAGQNEKRKRMAESGIPEPKNVRYIGVDLNEEDMFESLAQHGFDPGRRSVFSWFGVTYYLPIDTVRETLEGVVNKAASGSEIVFDFRIPLADVPSDWHKAHKKMGDYVAKRGEPFVTELSRQSMEQFVLDCGFQKVQVPTPDEIHQRYLANLPYKFVFTPTFPLCRAVSR